MSACPGCGAPAIGAPESVITKDGPWWCRPCLKAKVVAARAGKCHCSQQPAPHVHPNNNRSIQP